MAYFTALALVLLAGACHGGQRIIDGTPTTVERYPYIVQVESWFPQENAWWQDCGASILNELYILSAAHCFAVFYGGPYDPSWRRIRAGSTDRNIGGQVIYIVREFNHPAYNVAAPNDADITVVRLASFMSFTPVIQPVSLVSANSHVPDNSPAVIAGWGNIEPDSGPTQSPVLLKAQVYTVNNELCRDRYQNEVQKVVTRDMICHGVLGVGGRDTCSYDSGGPLYYRDTNILIGVISWNYQCGHPYLPSVSASVSSYIGWIQSIVG